MNDSPTTPGRGMTPSDGSWKSDLLRIKPPLMPVRTTLLLVAPVCLAFIVFTALNQPIRGLLVVLGAYIVLFGGGQPVQPRLRSYLIAAIGLHAAVTLGLLVGGHPLLTWLAYLAASVAAVLICRRFDPGPPGPYFFVLMVGGGTLLTATGLSLPVILVHLAAGSLLAMTAGSIDALITQRAATGNDAPDDAGSQKDPAPGADAAQAPEPPSPTPAECLGTERITLVRVCLAITLSLGISALRGDDHPFWGVLVAVLVLSYPGDRRALNVRALSRILGTLIGVLVFAPIAGLHLGSAGFVVALCVLPWFVARWTTRNYLIGSVLITVLALMMTVPLTANETPLQLTADRFVDTLVAGAIAMIVLQIVRTRQSRPKDAGSTGR